MSPRGCVAVEPGGGVCALDHQVTDRGKALLAALEQITLWAQEHLIEHPA